MTKKYQKWRLELKNMAAAKYRYRFQSAGRGHSSSETPGCQRSVAPAPKKSAAPAPKNFFWEKNLLIFFGDFFSNPRVRKIGYFNASGCCIIKKWSTQYQSLDHILKSVFPGRIFDVFSNSLNLVNTCTNYVKVLIIGGYDTFTSYTKGHIKCEQ